MGERKPLSIAPHLPYQGTEGFVARPASQERAEENARSGVSRDRQRQVLAALDSMPTGAIWTVLGHALQLHHGQVSSTLSVLHRAGEVFQLRRMVERSHPYVHAKYRYLYLESERYDFPVRTNASTMRKRAAVASAELATALYLLRDVEDAWLHNRDKLEAATASILTALDALNGKRDGE